MPIRMLVLGILFLAGPTISATSLTRLTPQEEDELNARIAEFYANPRDPVPMSHYIPKYLVSTGLPAHPNAFLKGTPPDWASPLERTAGRKLEPRFLKAESKFFAKRYRRHSHWEAVEDADQVENLTDGYLDAEHDLSSLPNSGRVSQDVWSDDYWKTQYGQTSYRYGEGKIFKNYKEAVGDYQQPGAFTTLLDLISPEKIPNELLKWSPAEKYDLTVGDTDFTLTNEEKEVGSDELGPTGDVESWMGICHGWAAAAIFAPRSVKPVKVVGAKGVPVKWFPDDVRAILSLSWANADIEANFAGLNCDEKTPETYPNGRIRNQNCFSTNPATLHLALANLIGRAKQAFIIDASFDYEIWNQPMKAYEFTYFNPLDPAQRSDDWTKVAVDYDSAFKAQDRFQHPLTRGARRSDGTWDDSGIRKVVGVIATLVYLGELAPSTSDAAPADQEVRVTYTYDLEFYDDDGLTPQGGEWHNNAHPNFNWVPVKHSIAAAKQDATDLGFTGSSLPGADLTKAAADASAEGMPLCQVIKGLLEQSTASGAEAYSCGN